MGGLGSRGGQRVQYRTDRFMETHANIVLLMDVLKLASHTRSPRDLDWLNTDSISVAQGDADAVFWGAT